MKLHSSLTSGISTSTQIGFADWRFLLETDPILNSSGNVTLSTSSLSQCFLLTFIVPFNSSFTLCGTVAAQGTNFPHCGCTMSFDFLSCFGYLVSSSFMGSSSFMDSSLFRILSVSLFLVPPRFWILLRSQIHLYSRVHQEELLFFHAFY
jgi:hypothetical protein